MDIKISILGLPTPTWLFVLDPESSSATMLGTDDGEKRPTALLVFTYRHFLHVAETLNSCGLADIQAIFVVVRNLYISKPLPPQLCFFVKSQATDLKAGPKSRLLVDASSSFCILQAQR